MKTCYGCGAEITPEHEKHELRAGDGSSFWCPKCIVDEGFEPGKHGNPLDCKCVKAEREARSAAS